MLLKYFCEEVLFACCCFQQKDQRFILFAYSLWAGVHDEVQFFAEKFVFAGNGHVVYDAASVVVFDAAFVKYVNTCTFGGGEN